MLKAILKALVSYDNGADFWDIVYHVRGQSVKEIPSGDIKHQLEILKDKGVLMSCRHHHYELIDTVK